MVVLSAIGAALGHVPAMHARAPAIFILVLFTLAVAFSLVAQGGFGGMGDGPYYLLMQQAWILTGAPSIDPSVIAHVSQRPDVFAADNWDMTMVGEGGLRYAWHFWFYSLLSVPFAIVSTALGQDPYLGFLAVNLLLALGAGLVLAQSKSLSLTAKTLIAVCFAATSLNWYGSWANPEVYTASLLLAASIAWLDKRFLLMALSAGAASLQNPSAVMILPVAGLAVLLAAWTPGSWRFDWRSIIGPGWRLAIGMAVAAAAPVFNQLTIGMANAIASNPVFVDFDSVTPARLWDYLFNLDQGALIGFPFLLTGLGAAVFVRWRFAGSRLANLVRRADLLLLAALLTTLPVLAQQNMNSGQYYVVRYLAWSLIPALAWLGAEITRSPRVVGAASIAGVAAYGLAFSVYLGEKVLETGFYGLRWHYDAAVFKPWTVMVLDRAPHLYNPHPEVFAERTLGREVYFPTEKLPVIYAREDGVITKVVAQQSAEPLDCPGGSLEATGEGGDIEFDRTSRGLVYVTGFMRCVLD